MEWQCTALMNFVSYIFSHHAKGFSLKFNTHKMHALTERNYTMHNF